MPHVLVAGKIHPDGIDLLRRRRDVTMDYVEEVTTDAYAPFIAEADALLIRTQALTAEMIARARKLRIVSRHGVGYDSVDVQALSRRGIALAVIGDVNSFCVAEHTMMLMLAAARRLPRYDALTRRGDWAIRNSLQAVELRGRRLLIIGFGRIGRRVAALAMAFDMKVQAFDPWQSDETIRAAGVEPIDSLARALADADVITVHAPPGDRPHIGADELKIVKPTAILINTARGGGVDEEALLDALAQKRLGAAGLDVFSDEPAISKNPLFGSDLIVVTPHAASLTEECGSRMALAAATNILAAFDNTLDPSLVVNADRIDWLESTNSVGQGQRPVGQVSGIKE